MLLLALKRKHVSRSGIQAAVTNGTWNRHDVAPGAVLLNPSRVNRIDRALVYMHIVIVLTLSCILALCFTMYSPTARILFLRRSYITALSVAHVSQHKRQGNTGTWGVVACKNSRALETVVLRNSPLFETHFQSTNWECQTLHGFISYRLLLQFQIVVL